ncbi:7629_t:CDS:1 [Funneliformis geosporum]|uniref:16873_t:CDS:1 n=1 Tax=Funneliformis geosporum TaxID=1117311 RepID=A0A9W4S980_9GLOM|nr:16873_t:CDS:1 [Funneliformis geosporum]CAI2161691.1 7629_t:CDS:1 [Funneliformis geosporum]
MAAASLPELCLERIFEYLRCDLNSQYSCILINKYWCSSLIAKLWENPFEMIKTKNKTRSNLYLINTYLIYLPKDIQNSIGLQEISKQPLFNYASFLRYLSIQNIKYSIKKWARFKDVNETPKFKTFLFNKENNEIPGETIGYIAEVFIEHLFTSSTYIKGVDQLCPIPCVFGLPNAESKLSQIQIFKCDDDKMIRLASKISRDIQQLEIRLKAKETYDLEHKSYLPLKDIAMLIRAQRNLRKILIQYNPTIYSKDENVCLWDNLMKHTKSLVDIIFVGVSFDFKFPLGCLSKFHNLRRLTLVDCEIDNAYPLDYIPPSEDDHQDNIPLLIRDMRSFHQVEFLSIRTSKININKLEILFRQAAFSLRWLELLDLDHLTNLESITQCFSNITRLTVGISERWKIVISIVKSANLLQELYVLDERNENFRNNFSERYACKPMTADSFLCEVGKAMGKQVYMFRFTLDWYFCPNSLNTFLKRCNVKRLKILDFRKFKFFSNEHLNQVIAFCGGTLSYLYCEHHHTITQADLSRAKQVIRNFYC